MLLNAPFALTLGLSHASLAPPPRARPVPRRGRAQAEEHLRGDGADAFDELGADAVPPGALGRESKHYLPAEEKWRQGDDSAQWRWDAGDQGHRHDIGSDQWHSTEPWTQ